MNRLFTLLILIFAFAYYGNAQVGKTLVKSLAIETTTSYTTKAIVELSGDVTVSEWNKNYIRITTYVEVLNMNENIVKQLVMVGRYTIEGTINEETQTLYVSMPNISNMVTVKGVEISEVLSFEVSIPEGYNLIINGNNEINTNLIGIVM
ncbi:MAG: hypothetical protein MK207_00945 [Saprospiraceae bacterium]|nr:hypothetical protein [Saprospiraceae bacterium]